MLDLVTRDITDDDLVEVCVDPGYMAQKFHRMVNFKLKSLTENKMIKKIIFSRKNYFVEDISSEKVHYIEIKRCQRNI